jgi:thymidylate synthase (FAD)
MIVIKPSIEILTKINSDEVLKMIELAGRTCYKSESNITKDSAKDFVKMLIKRGHEAMIEHYNVTIRFICDRGVTHEIVRHRIASYAQESTRYCNYSKDKFGNEITVIKPCFWDEFSPQYIAWYSACARTQDTYFDLLKLGSTPQEARSVLPNSLKTEIVVTMNLREWRHFFKLRTAKTAHPQMREVAIMALNQMKEMIPVVFHDIEEEQ